MIRTSWLKPYLPYSMLSMIYIIFFGLYSIISEKGSLLLWLAERRTPWLNTFFLWVTRLGEVYVFLAVIFIFMFISYRKSALFSLVGIMSLVVSFIAKSIFSQPRPLTYFTEMGMSEKLGVIHGHEFYSAFTSMPSGHTMAAFSFFFALVVQFKKPYLQTIAFLLAAGVGISRIYLGQHFAGDVAAGSLIGLGIGILSYYLVFIIWADRKRMDGSLIRP